MTFAVTLPMKCFRQAWGRNLCHFAQSRHSNVSASKQLGGIEGIFATKLTNEHNNAWSQPISGETGCDQHPVSDLYSSLRSLTSVMRGDKPIDATVTWSEASLSPWPNRNLHPIYGPTELSRKNKTANEEKQGHFTLWCCKCFRFSFPLPFTTWSCRVLQIVVFYESCDEPT